MPPMNAKNTPISSAGVDLGLAGSTKAEDDEEERKRKMRLAQQAGAQSGLNGPSRAFMDLGLI